MPFVIEPNPALLMRAREVAQHTVDLARFLEAPGEVSQADMLSFMDELVAQGAEHARLLSEIQKHVTAVIRRKGVVVRRDPIPMRHDAFGQPLA